MPSANNTASKYVSIVLVFKSAAEKKKKRRKQFLLDTIYVSSEQNDTVDSVWRQKECLTAAAAAAQEHI